MQVRNTVQRQGGFLPELQGQKSKGVLHGGQLFVCLIAVACLVGCAAFERTYQGNCVSESLFRAHVMEKNGYATRIAVMETDNPRVLHAQAQALINGEWRWLKSDPAYVYPGDQEIETAIIEYRDINGLIDQRRKVTN